MTVSGWMWRGFLALIGCVAAGYVGDELLGGKALGWTVGGAILALFCYPLFKALFAWRAARDAR